MAKRYGVNRTAQVLRVKYGGLRKRAENPVRPKAKRQKTEPAGFLEFLAPHVDINRRIKDALHTLVEMLPPAQHREHLCGAAGSGCRTRQVDAVVVP